MKAVEKLGLTEAVKYNEPLSKHTTFRIGGPVRAMYFPKDAETLVRLCEHYREQGVAAYIIGRGSNILASDKVLDIIVINTVKMNDFTLTDTVITAQSGVALFELALAVQNAALTGLEFAHGIPGTLGGAIVMNAGAYGGEMKDAVIETTAYSMTKGKYTITGDEHKFAYRSSAFSDSDDVILSATLCLQKGDRFEIEQKTAELNARRRESQPLDKPSAGSTFKRPEGGYAAALIDEAGLKGYKIGGAQVSEKHAGFIVNTGDATFDDVSRLIDFIRETVEKRTGITLEPEVKVWRS